MTSSTSFITQCPRCATKFKVTQEQLSISEGWVRCGRCQHIFDAKNHLIDGPDSLAQTESQPEPAGLPVPSTLAIEPDKTSTASAAPEQGAGPISQYPTDAQEGDPRPSERWLKELSDTFSPTSPTASLAIAAASAITAPASKTPGQPSANEHAEETANELDKVTEGASDALATEAPSPAQTSSSPPLFAAAAPAEASAYAAKPHQDDNNISRFHDELAQWQSKQSPVPVPEPQLPESAATSAFTDGRASPVLIHASGTPAPDSEHSKDNHPAQTSAAPTASANSPAETRPAIDLGSPEQAASTAAGASDAPETEEARAAREEEERLERYRAEFSETQELRFMREAEQKAFWRRPIVRLCMAVLALLLLTLLAAQWAYVQRDSIAALSPQWKVRMQQACAWADCRIAPLQSIEDLVLDGSTFQHVAGNRYILSWTLRNRSKRWIETPALSLSLRNDAGQTLVRRTITVADIAQSPPELAPAGAWKVEQHLELSDHAEAITGYQLQIFYPHAAP